jgi:group II intron reverse transcriptase/maturase
MLTVTTIKRLDALGKLSEEGKRINGLFRLLENPTLWLQAYGNIYANKGATTPGSDGKSLDGFSNERILTIIKELKENQYRFQPAKRVYIPKANGKQRPLNIPSGNDKLVAEVIRMILERIYEPVFLKESHGFRPNKSCHTALKDIKKRWTSVKWIIDTDIENFYNNIHHATLLKLLEMKIEDKKFVHLIKLMLRAGYIEDWKFQETYSGTSQGSIASPILSNIYLHQLDLFMAEKRKEFNQGKKRKFKKEYKKITAAGQRLMKKIDNLKLQENTFEEIQQIKERIRVYDKQRKSITATEPFDLDYKRLLYCRYADDFVVGIIGSKQEAIKIRNEMEEFVNKLHLNISKEKSHIAHGRKGARFLGHNIRTYTNNKIVRTIRSNRHTTVKSMSGKMQLCIPRERLRLFCKDKKYGDYETMSSTHRSGLINHSDAEIIKTYNAEIRGLVNYYSMSLNFWDMNKLVYIWRNSLLKTLAAKHKTSMSRTISRLKTEEGFALTVRTKSKTYNFKIFKLKAEMRQSSRDERVDEIPNTKKYMNSRTELVQRLGASRCEYCEQQDDKLEVHHVRKLKDLEKGKKLWQIIMARKQRKTLVICRNCHHLLHAGRLPDWRSRKKQVESRMN